MITFITGNEHKVIEAEDIFKNFGVKLEHIDLGYCEPQGTLEEVAKSGAKYACRKLNKSVIVEDAGLFIKALNGFPGTYSSYVQETLGNEGILKLMNNVNDRYAEFRSVIGYCAPNSEPKVFSGHVKGQIALEEKGNHQKKLLMCVTTSRFNIPNIRFNQINIIINRLITLKHEIKYLISNI